MAAAHDGETNIIERFITTNPWTVATSKTTAGVDRVGIVTFHVATGGLDGPPTWNGVEMTLVDSVTFAVGGATLYMYRIVNPPTAASVISVPINTPVSGPVGISSYNGVDQTTPIRASADATGSDATPTVNVGSAIGDIVVDACSMGNLITSNQTENYTDVGGTDEHSSSRADGAASVTMSYSSGGGAAWSIIAASLQASGASGPTLPWLPRHTNLQGETGAQMLRSGMTPPSKP